MKRDYKLFLQDIISAMETIEQFVEGMSLEDFRKNDMIISAVLYKFEVIGEAAKRIPRNYAGNTQTSRGRRWRACGIGLFMPTSALTIISFGRPLRCISPKLSSRCRPCWRTLKGRWSNEVQWRPPCDAR